MKQIFMAVSVSLFFAATAGAYTGGAVTNGGMMKGTVRVTGNIPQDETIKVTKDNQHCGDTLPREKYIISASGGVKNAVVLIENISAGKPLPTAPLEIDNVKCAFVPHVQVGVKGQDLIIKNTDPMLHNTHLYLNKRTVYNFALPLTGMEVKRPIKKAGIISVECDAHAWMKGYLYIADHPYITVTDANGAFSLTNVPAGTYKIKIWHEALGEQEQNVTIPEGGAAEVTVEYKQ